MKRTRYEPKVKAAIIAAVHDARKSGKTWAETLEPAKQAGYKGTAGGIVQLVNASQSVKKTKATKTEAPAATAKKTRQKRKARIITAPATKAPTASAPASSPLDITALVQKTVTDAVVNALESLVASLKSGK